MKKPARITWDASASAPENARRFLPGLVSNYFARGRDVLARRPDPAALHPLRLATKRLRYTLELFRPCYGPGLATRLAALRRIQQLLGEINDAAAAGRVLAGALPRASSQRSRASRFLRERAAAKAREFEREWNRVFDAPGRERWWTSYLSRNSRDPSRKG